VTDTLAAGVAITNVATLEAMHALPDRDEVETFDAEATSYIATGADFSTSYKDAPETVLTDGEIEYEVHVINSGDEIATVTVHDPIPANTTYAWHISPPPNGFGYNAAEDRMEWTGHVAPGDEIVLVYAVEVNHGVIQETITNTATITWDGMSLDLDAMTEVVWRYIEYLPILMN